MEAVSRIEAGEALPLELRAPCSRVWCAFRGLPDAGRA